MATVEEKYKVNTVEESVLSKDWAAGSVKQLESTEVLIRSADYKTFTGSIENVTFPPALWKISDEPMVNWIDYSQSSGKVTTAKISYNKTTGRISIWNDGPGIEVCIHKEASAVLKREIYVPTFLFSELFQGSNKTKSPDSITGGTNGIGVKLTLIFSSDCVVETVDPTRNLHFVQRWEKNKTITHPPQITDLSQKHTLPKDRCVPHTVISFIPDFEKFGYTDTPNHDLIHDLLLTRSIFAAVYSKVKVYFNNVLLPFKNMVDIARVMFPKCTIISSTITPKAVKNPLYKHPWEIVAVISNGSPMNEISNVNGIMVRSGQHTQAIMARIVECMTTQITKAFNDKSIPFNASYVKNNLFLMINAKIPAPSWTGQRKDIMQIDIRKLSEYTLDNKFINGLKDHLCDEIVSVIFNKEQKKTTRKNQKVDYDKYWPAEKAGGKHSEKCSLWLFEGDSAIAQGKTGHGGNTDFVGLMSTKGVPVNTRKESTIVKTSAGELVKHSEKMKNNLFINAIIAACGLDFKAKYLPGSPEIKRLNYGHIVACVDQDDDGKGNILGSITNTFHRFWPNLLAAGYIRWFCTAIIRAVPKKAGKQLHFHSILEYEEWAKTVDLKKFTIKYYKGLGTHSRDEIKFMFKTFDKQLYTYYIDERTTQMFETYFGKEPDLRKQKLSLPPVPLDRAVVKQQIETKLISCSDHLEHDTDAYQRDNLERKLDHVIDGQNQAGRMILNSILKYWAVDHSKQVKVAQLSGYISEHENYHHGEDSLQNSIINRAFVAPGGKQLPFLVPLSQFGTRLQGGGDHASARYIYTKLNYRLTDLLFPKADYPNLEFQTEDGESFYPKYFVPIIPIVCAESTEIPSHGWKLKLWARNVYSIIDNVKRLIRQGDNVRLLPMAPTTYAGAANPWNGYFQTIRGEPYSFGRYHIPQPDTIVITELPLRVWTDNYIAHLNKYRTKKNSLILDIIDKSSDVEVYIIVKLIPGGQKEIEELGGDSVFTDPFEEFLQLRNHMDSHINLMTQTGAVKSFTNYEDPMYEHFTVRKVFYAARIERDILLLNMKIQYWEQIIKFVDACKNGLSLARMKKAAMVDVLEQLEYKKINHVSLKDNRDILTKDLHERILGESATYNYLLCITELMKSEEEVEKYTTKLDKLKTKLAKYIESSAKGRFPGAQIWEEELDALKSVIAEGIKDRWMFGETLKNPLE